MEWIKFAGGIDEGTYIVCTENKIVTEMKYISNKYAKTNRGRAPRWEWHGRVSPWKVTHFMEMPSPPSD
ncbi:hypothetical protein PMPD1_3125 [Paramixta manurensis]|uniref:DUF551 domain-containing protein n=1 Tax=Paramixta manurensis TaxID=2740817 RepID=A0A6M8UI34_9GAMM|nr:hypothetical protein PMPD1_3125 [Erwiniaceae bacterium PD-1]